jgi:CRISPR/Cas system-associated exonuclease Cas4 (RecB family)
MKIQHISVSRLQCYDLCQAQYKYKYHLEVRTDVPTPFYFTFGKIVHKIIEEHTRSKGAKTVSRVKSEVLSGQTDLEPGLKAPPLDNESHRNLSTHLNNYSSLVSKIGYEGQVEWPFYIDVDKPNGKMIKGFIDRLVIKDDSACVIDYKTTKPSKWRKDSTTITKDLQLACYCWAVMNEFKIAPKKIKAALYYLADAKLVPVSFSEKTLLSVPERLSKAYEEIQRADPDRVMGNVGDHCRRCDYRKICPFYSLT